MAAPLCLLRASQAPQTPKAQTLCPGTPLPSNNAQKFHWAGLGQTPFPEPTHLGQSLPEMVLPAPPYSIDLDFECRFKRKKALEYIQEGVSGSPASKT